MTCWKYRLPLISGRKDEMVNFNAFIMELSLVEDLYGKPVTIVRLETPDGVDSSQTNMDLRKYFRGAEKVKVTIDATD